MQESNHSKLKVMVYGLGYIGRAVVEAIQNETWFWNRPLELVGVVDIVPQSRAWAEKQGVPAFGSLKDLLRKAKPEVCILTTASNLSMIVSQIKELVSEKIPVVSSSEELFFPWIQNKKTADDLDNFCKKAGVAILGTGVNPGFVMDVLPAICTQTCHTIEKIRVERVVNASTRRPSLQRKIGAGLDEASFRAMVASGRIGHVGLMESLDFLASYMGWTLSTRSQKIEPITAPKSLKTQVISIKKGQVCGLHHQAWGEIGRKRVIELDLVISLKAEKPGDHISIEATPSFEMTIEGGTPGDSATVSSLLRAIPIVLQARPGIVRRLERDHFL